MDEAGFISHPAAGSAAMPTYRQYLKDSPGMPLQDLWTYQPHTSGVLYGTDECIDADVRWLVAQGDTERLGYPTQKPVGLLTRIIQSSCPPDGIVLDPFCGCGTTIDAAERLHRKWIGIDITHLAIALINKRLSEVYKSDLSPYEVKGVPTSTTEAQALAAQNRHQFEWWAIYKVGAYPAQNKKKGADQGIDGYLLFFDDKSGQAKRIVVQVKSGHVSAKEVRDLRGVVEREKAVIGVLITLEAPTGPMKTEALSMGFYEPEFLPGTKYRKLQILTIDDIFKGTGIDYPKMLAPDVTTKKAARVHKDAPPEQETFGYAKPATSKKKSPKKR